MARLSMTEVGNYAAGAGFNGKGLSTAIAVAYAESGGNPNATGPVGEKGLWQVYPRMHQDWDKGGNLYDPAYNARAAFAISGGGKNWRPWTTYNIGSYLLYLPQAEIAAQRVKPIKGIGAAAAQAGTHLPDTSAVAGNIASGVGSVLDIGKAISFLSNPQHWIRIAEVIAGGILVILALGTILRPVVEPAVKTAVKVGAVVA